MVDEEKHKTKFDRIGKRWRESVDKVKEYEIIDGEEEGYGEFIPSTPFGIDYREYHEAEELKQRLLKKYEGKKLQDLIEGEELKTPKVVCYHIESHDTINLKVINPEHARR